MIDDDRFAEPERFIETMFRVAYWLAAFAVACSVILFLAHYPLPG